MSKVREAILRGIQEAARVHMALGIGLKGADAPGRIDVFDSIAKLNLPLLFRPLENLLGVFLPEPNPGILVTTKRPLSVQRFTGAHELGHYSLGHKPSFDEEDILRRSPFSAESDYDLQEMEADAFAVEFLLPKWLIATQMKKRGWMADDMGQPEKAYQLSLRVGASYDATCRVLERYKVITPPIRERLLSTKPQSIKERLIGGPDYTAGWSDVWILSEHDEGTVIEGGKNDLFILRLNEHSGAGYLWTLDDLKRANFAILEDKRVPLDADTYGGEVTRWITARSTISQIGEFALAESRPWLPEQSLSSIRYRYELTGPETEGLSRAERKQLWGVA